MSTVDLAYPGDLAAGTGITFRANMNTDRKGLYNGLNLHQVAIEALCDGYIADGTLPGNTAECYIDTPTAGQVYCEVGYQAIVGGVPVVTSAILSDGYTAAALNHVFLVLSSTGALSLRVSTSADISANELWIADVSAVPAIDNAPTGKATAYINPLRLGTTAVAADLDKVAGALGSLVQCTRLRMTAAEINAGHTFLSVGAAQKFRLVDFVAIPIGGAAGAVTAIQIKCGAIVLASLAQAELLQSAILRPGATGVTMLADGASYAQMSVGDDVTVIKDGSDITTMTHLDLIVWYVVE